MSAEHAAHVLFRDALAGRVNRRELVQRAAALGLSAPVVAALGQASFAAALAEEGTLKVAFYDWILDLHPRIDQVNEEFTTTFPLVAEVAPVQAASFDVFVSEARDQTSTWDVYFGATPFAEYVALIDTGAAEPWDAYIPQEILNDIVPTIRDEGTIDGKLYNWPFLLDIVIQGWHAGIVEQAGLDPETAPQTWDEFIANAKQVVESGAAPYGCTFDRGGWRSLAPISHSISTDVYTEDGRFDFTNPAVVEALEIMKRMMEYANPDVLDPGSSEGGFNATTDEAAFAREQVAYYVKYQNAHLRMSGRWPDPSQLRLAALSKTPDGVGGTVFWTVGATLLKYGQNKEQAVNYVKTLTYDDQLWQNSFVGGDGEPPVGQMPPYSSIWEGYETEPPSWMPDWPFLVLDQLASGKARSIRPHKFGIQQFFPIGDPYWHKYLSGEISDALTALQQAKDAVEAEMKKSG
jgi:multiple sugar transport system substrate-binding protein